MKLKTNFQRIIQNIGGRKNERILITAFGLDQTLGNILFAATFLITDILSVCFGKKEANKAVYMGLFVQIFFLLLSQSWLLYKPAAGDGSMDSINTIFSNTPRMILASFSVYAVSQMFDVWLYIINGGSLPKKSLGIRKDSSG